MTLTATPEVSTGIFAERSNEKVLDLAKWFQAPRPRLRRAALLMHASGRNRQDRRSCATSSPFFAAAARRNRPVRARTFRTAPQMRRHGAELLLNELRWANTRTDAAPALMSKMRAKNVGAQQRHLISTGHHFQQRGWRQNRTAQAGTAQVYTSSSDVFFVRSCFAHPARPGRR